MDTDNRVGIDMGAGEKGKAGRAMGGNWDNSNKTIKNKKKF